MTVLEKYIHAMNLGDNIMLADLFHDQGVLHDSSVTRVGKDTLHLVGKMAIEMMFHHRFGFNGGPFKISSINYQDEKTVCYFINYGDKIIPVTAFLADVDEDGKIKRLNIYPM